MFEPRRKGRSDLLVCLGFCAGSKIGRAAGGGKGIKALGDEETGGQRPCARVCSPLLACLVGRSEHGRSRCCHIPNNLESRCSHVHVKQATSRTRYCCTRTSFTLHTHPSRTTSASPGWIDPCRAAWPSGVTRNTLQPSLVGRRRRWRRCCCRWPPSPWYCTFSSSLPRRALVLASSSTIASSSRPSDPASKATRVQATGGGGRCRLGGGCLVLRVLVVAWL